MNERSKNRGQMKSNFFLSLIALTTVFFLGCDRWQMHSGSQPGSIVKTFSGAPNLTVQDINGNPIASAQIMIGDSVGVPFANNVLTADANGTLAVPTAWTAPTSLSISAAGFVTASFLHTLPIAGIFKLRKQVLQNTVEYSGNTTGYPAFDDFSIAHISLVFEAINRSELANFSLAKIMSPESDSFSVLNNTVNVPSNLSIPDQTLSYIIHINVSKPLFRIPLQAASDHVMVGLHAQFPVTDLVRSVRNKASLFEMVNFFKLHKLKSTDPTCG